MYYIDEKLTKTKAFKEQLDQHAEILLGDGKAPKKERKPILARINGMWAAISKVLHPQVRALRQN